MLRSRERASVVLENNFIQQESNLTHKNTLLERERERETRNCVRTRDIYIYTEREGEDSKGYFAKWTYGANVKGC